MNRTQAPPEVAPREFFPQLTSVRFFAAFFVVLYHYEKLLADHLPLPLKNLTHHGFVGVSFFFILSGYILGSNYYQKFVDGKAKKSDFFFARFARIYPLYLISILVMTPRVFLNLPSDPHPEQVQLALDHPFRVVIGHLFALQSFDYRIGEIFNAPTWSISTEFFFYLTFPIAIPLIARISTRDLPRAALALFGFAVVPPLMYHTGAFAIFAGWLGWEYPTDVDNLINQGVRMIFLFRLPEFLIGVLGYRLYREILQYDRDWAILQLKRFCWITGAGFLGFVFFQPLEKIVKSALLMGQVMGIPFFLSSILLLVLCNGPVVKALSAKWLVVLGEASFALYLIHLPIKQFVRFILPRVLHIDPETPLVLWGTIGFTVLISIPVFYYIETPARKVLMRWWKRRQANSLQRKSEEFSKP